ncbi:MAG: general secretion pathway protein GspB [Candidatus Omnitrophica bacterium]|nr:general secretion pathway protein GspB [Candidatus Omnitrophota bacterium]
MWSGKRVALVLACLIFCFPAVFAQDEFVYPDDDDFERDPFEALINAEGIINVRLVRRAGDLKINGIIYSENEEQRRAIINNTLVKKDDYIGTYKVENIGPASVTLTIKGKETILKMKEEE